MSSPGLPASPVLVTGANGFIGSALTRALLRAGCDARGLILTGTDPGPLTALKTPVFFGDVRRPDSLVEPLDGVRTVFHLAALARDWGPVSSFLQINADGTRNLLEASVKAGAQRFVHMSTLAVHSFTGHVDADETTPADNQANGYCVSKIIAEAMVRQVQARGAIETTIIRPGAIIFGPGDTTTFLQLAPTLKRGRLPLVGGGRSLICYSYVENLAAGMILAAAKPDGAGETFVLTDDLKINLRDHLAATCRALDVEAKFFWTPQPLAKASAWMLERLWLLARRPSSPPINQYRVGIFARDFHFSCDKAKRVLGYRPEVGYTEGLERTVRWYRSYLSGAS